MTKGGFTKEELAMMAWRKQQKEAEKEKEEEEKESQALHAQFQDHPRLVFNSQLVVLPVS